MKFFALETNVQKTKRRFLATGESEIFFANRHIMSFIVQILWEIILTVLFASFFTYMASFGVVSPLFALIGFLLAWFSFVFFGFVRGYLDWKYDFLFLTTDKLVVFDQTSLFRSTVTPISLENLGDVAAETQWLNLFGFGIIRFALKEGKGEIKMKYMRNADTLVSMISEQITLYQRRKDYVVPYRERQ